MPDSPPPLFGLPQRLPPTNVQAEQALLGAILANNKALDRCQGLQPEHFADPVHGRIYAEVCKLVAAGRVADPVTLKTVFEHVGVLEEVGGTAYLVQLLSAMVATNIAGDYARVIRDCWLRRELIDVGAVAVELAFGADSDVDGEAAVTATMERLLSLGERSGVADEGAFADAIDEAVARAEAAHRGGGDRALMTGIQSVDDLWEGLYPGELNILGARAKHGKTALGMQVAEHVARTLPKGEHVQIFSLEMQRKDLALRMLASTTGIPANELRRGKIGGARAESIVLARRELRSLPLVVQDKPGMTLADIRIAARIAVRRRKVRLIVIDHLHRVKPDTTMRRMDRHGVVVHVAEALKDLAKTLDVPVLLLAQISRQSERREEPESQRPRESDLMYGGEQDADNILLLWRPELYMGESPPALPDRITAEKRAEANAAWHARRNKMRNMAELIKAKGRFGPTGSVWLAFDGPRTRFSMPQDRTTTDLWTGSVD